MTNKLKAINTIANLASAAAELNKPKNTEDLQKMKSKASAFETSYEDYYADIKNDEDMTYETTQPYWQSLYLSKQKLKKNNLQMHIDLTEAKSKKGLEATYYNDDGKNQIATFKHPLIVHKSFTQDGKILYNKKEKKIGLINVIKASTDGDKVACPNCGHMGTVASYIDGCDYCNAKFEVNEFQEMISSMNIEDDVKQKTTNMYKKSFFTSAAIIAFCVLAFVLSLAYIIYCDISGADSRQSLGASAIFVSTYKMIPVIFAITILLVIAFVIICAYFFNKTYKRVEDTPALQDFKRYYSDLSPEKFAQELEYKLRNIHFAENAEEVSAFANIDLTDVVRRYENIIESNLVKVKILDFKKESEQCTIQVLAVLRNFRIKGNKITPYTEQVILNLSCRKEALKYNTTVIKMHRCAQCGSSVSLLNGGICTYCNTKLDYSLYSFIIESYYSDIKETDLPDITQNIAFGNHKYRDTAALLRQKLAVFLIIAVLISCGILYQKCGRWFYMLINFDSYAEYMMNINERLETIDSVCIGLETVSSKEDYFDRYFKYQSKYSSTYDTSAAVQAYGEYLETQGYKLYFDYNNVLIYSKKIVFDSHLSGYHFIKMYYGTSSDIEIYYEMEDEKKLSDDDIYQ